MPEHQAGRVPVSVIVPIIKKWMRDRQNDSQYTSSSYVSNSGDGGYDILGFQCGISGRQLRRIVAGKMMGGNRHSGYYPVDYISFDTADKIITAIDVNLWRKEPLKQFYGPLEVTHGELKKGYELPEGFDWDGLPTAKKYLWSNARMRNEVAA